MIPFILTDSGSFVDTILISREIIFTNFPPPTSPIEITEAEPPRQCVSRRSLGTSEVVEASGVQAELGLGVPREEGRKKCEE